MSWYSILLTCVCDAGVNKPMIQMYKCMPHKIMYKAKYLIMIINDCLTDLYMYYAILLMIVLECISSDIKVYCKTL